MTPAASTIPQNAEKEPLKRITAQLASLGVWNKRFSLITVLLRQRLGTDTANLKQAAETVHQILVGNFLEARHALYPNDLTPYPSIRAHITALRALLSDASTTTLLNTIVWFCRDIPHGSPTTNKKLSHPELSRRSKFRTSIADALMAEGFKSSNPVLIDQAPRGFYQPPVILMPAYEGLLNCFDTAVKNLAYQRFTTPPVVFKSLIDAGAPRTREKDIIRVLPSVNTGDNPLFDLVLPPEHTIMTVFQVAAQLEQLGHRMPLMLSQNANSYRLERFMGIESPGSGVNLKPGKFYGARQLDMDIFDSRDIGMVQQVSHDATSVRNLHKVLIAMFKYADKQAAFDNIPLSINISNRRLIEGICVCHGLNYADVQTVISVLDTFEEDLEQKAFVAQLIQGTSEVKLSPAAATLIYKLLQIDGEPDQVIAKLHEFERKLPLDESSGKRIFHRGIKELQLLHDDLKLYPEIDYKILLKLCRTCPIYAGNVWEAVHKKLAQYGSFAGGGSCGRVSEELTGRSMYVCGSAIGGNRMAGALLATDNYHQHPTALVVVTVGRWAIDNLSEYHRQKKYVVDTADKFRGLGITAAELNGPVEDIIEHAKAHNIPYIYDAAQRKIIEVASGASTSCEPHTFQFPLDLLED